jgi:SagB-type dehydrogenase family enzyme
VANTDVSAALSYHAATNHSLERLTRNQHGLDWPNQPLPFKIYTSLNPLPLEGASTPRGAGLVDRELLGHLCFFSNGVTKLLRGMPFRAAACTGALYHIEIYIVCGDLPGLEAGVYQYAAHDHSLRQIRRGDFRRTLVEASGEERCVAAAPAILVCTSTFWRNAWKYRARAYRHCFWDCGTMLANLFGVAANSIPARLVVGFADSAVNALLDVDPTQEASLCLIALGDSSASAPQAPPIEPLDLPTQRLSPSQVEYPAIVEMHAASSLHTGAEAAAWRSATEPGVENSVPTADAPIEDVIRRRGSSRRFLREPIQLQQLQQLLTAAAPRVPSDLGDTQLCDAYLIVNAVDGLYPGAYFYDRPAANLELLRAGDVRETAAFLDLGQPLAGDAAVNVYSMANLPAVLSRFGNRGYRAAQLEGGIEGGKLYLAAYALGLGATGLTFFDDEVVRFFSPHAAGKSVMFLTAIGQPVRPRQ